MDTQLSRDDYYKRIIEAILFISEKPVTVEQINDAMDELSNTEIKKCIKAVQTEYDEQDRGMTIMEIAGGYQMLSSPHYNEAIRRFFLKKVKEKLSRPALETLAIIAYKQPVSRSDIEMIRGVNSDGVVAHLLSKDLIKIVGRKEVPGRPYIYGTTKQFLEYFGLKSLRDLPKLEDFPSLVAAAQQRDEDAEHEAQEERADTQDVAESAAEQVPEQQTSEVTDEAAAQDVPLKQEEESHEQPETQEPESEVVTEQGEVELQEDQNSAEETQQLEQDYPEEEIRKQESSPEANEENLTAAHCGEAESDRRNEGS